MNSKLSLSIEKNSIEQAPTLPNVFELEPALALEPSYGGQA
jgi:hypothetical protein